HSCAVRRNLPHRFPILPARLRGTIGCLLRGRPRKRPRRWGPSAPAPPPPAPWCGTAERSRAWPESTDRRTSLRRTMTGREAGGRRRSRQPGHRQRNFAPKPRRSPILPRPMRRVPAKLTAALLVAAARPAVAEPAVADQGEQPAAPAEDGFL